MPIPSENAASRIRAAVKRVESTPLDLTGSRRGSQSGPSGFWARIAPGPQPYFAGDGMGGHSWERVIPRPGGTFTRDADGVTGLASAHNTITRQCPPGEVVFLNFIGFLEQDDEEGHPVEVPQYVFTWGQEQEYTGLRPHDHRDNFNGGYAFAVYHPGTSLPQMPWAL